MRDCLFPKLRSSITLKKIIPFPPIYIIEDEDVEVKTDNYVLKYCLKQLVLADIDDFESFKIYMQARYEFFSFVSTYKKIQKEPISNLHVNKKFTTILFYSVSVSYEKFVPNTIVDSLGRTLSLNESSKNYILDGNINFISLKVTALYEFCETPARQSVHVHDAEVGDAHKRKLF